MEDKKYVDPTSFTETDLPIICLSDDLRGWLGFAIKSHTKGNYNHILTLNKVGKCASQDPGGFHEKPISTYMIPSQMLKFWRVRNLTESEKLNIQLAIKKRLSLPWWKQIISYDFFGVFVGQFLRAPWLQNPWQVYCSEQVRIDYLSKCKTANKIVPKEPSPSDLNRIFEANPEIFECLGYWWGD